MLFKYLTITLLSLSFVMGMESQTQQNFEHSSSSSQIPQRFKDPKEENLADLKQKLSKATSGKDLDSINWKEWDDKIGEKKALELMRVAYYAMIKKGNTSLYNDLKEVNWDYYKLKDAFYKRDCRFEAQGLNN